jgi:hypothetical protein
MISENLSATTKYYKLITEELTYYYSDFIIQDVFDMIFQYYEDKKPISGHRLLMLSECCYDHNINNLIKCRMMYPKDEYITDGTLDKIYNVPEKNIIKHKKLKISDLVNILNGIRKLKYEKTN